MAFREQTGFYLTERRFFILEQHPMCVHSTILPESTWRFSVRRSAGRLFRMPKYKDNFRDSCSRWKARTRLHVFGDLVFVSYRPPTDSFRRLAFFRYRRDITKALDDVTVIEVMES